jgi:hypothetical protein
MGVSSGRCRDCKTDTGDEHRPECKLAPRCPRCARDLSDHEWTAGVYVDADDYVRKCAATTCANCQLALIIIPEADADELHRKLVDAHMSLEAENDW